MARGRVDDTRTDAVDNTDDCPPNHKRVISGLWTAGDTHGDAVLTPTLAERRLVHSPQPLLPLLPLYITSL